jgi:AmpD protein
MSAARITGHSNIATGRKTDPGPIFDRDLNLASLEQPGKPDNAMLGTMERERSR